MHYQNNRFIKEYFEILFNDTQSGTQNYNSGNNIIIADGQAKTLEVLMEMIPISSQIFYQKIAQ